MILLFASECVLASLANKARKYRFGDKKDYAYAFVRFPAKADSRSGDGGQPRSEAT
jgi:hypothetical protein